MALGDPLVVTVSLAVLFLAGWLFLNHSLYRDFEEKDTIVQVGRTDPKLDRACIVQVGRTDPKLDRACGTGCCMLPGLQPLPGMPRTLRTEADTCLAAVCRHCSRWCLRCQSTCCSWSCLRSWACSVTGGHLRQPTTVSNSLAAAVARPA